MDVFSMLLDPVTWIITTLTILYFLYRKGTENYDFFTKLGVTGPKPIPYIGNLWGIWNRNWAEYDTAMYNRYGKYFGVFEADLPTLFIADPDMIRSIFVKDFDHFINHMDYHVHTKYIRKFLDILQDQEWKDVRSAISPVFTTGKIKKMTPIIKDCADRLVDDLTATAEQAGKLDTRRLSSKFTVDVIARCAFGMKIDNLGEENNPFMKNGDVAFRPATNKTPMLLIRLAFPKLASLIGDGISGTPAMEFFIEILENLFKERADSKLKYNDFIEIAIESVTEMAAREGNGTGGVKWNREEVEEIIIGQALLFFMAGFDTTATTLTNVLYLLAKNPEVQGKLHDLIVERIEQIGDVNHEMIQDFPYLDHVITETLRLYPPLPRLDRTCNKDYEYNGIKIRKGMLVKIPTHVLHHSAEYYPDPEKFDPGRYVKL